MPQILKPSDVAKRIAAGESTQQIFVDASGGYKAKLVGPQAEVGAVSESDRAVEFVISTEAVDRYTDTVKLGGWMTQNYVRNPVVLWAHDDSIPAIGRSAVIQIINGALRASAVFAGRDVHPLADTVFQLLKGKFINAASVGFVPLKAKSANSADRPFGLDILEQELLEWSVVNVPANPECLVQARSIGIDCSPLIGWAEKVLDSGDMLMIPRGELEALRKAAGAATVGKPLQRADSADWKCGASRDLALDEGDAWDGPAAAKRMLDACGFDGDKPDTSKARKGFLAYDAANPTLRGSYKLPFADIVSGELKAVAGGIRAAASRLPQTDIPQAVKDTARGVLDHYEGKMGDANKSSPARKIKSLWHVAWLADILMDLDMLEDCVSWEANLENDGSPIPQKLADALKTLGQLLIDLTTEEVGEMLAPDDGEGDTYAPMPMEMAAKASGRMRVLRLLAGAQAKTVAAVADALAPQKPGSLVDLVAAKAAIEASLKAGRVLSAENEAALRSACDHMTNALDQVNAVVAACNPSSDTSKNKPAADDALALRQRRAKALRLQHSAA